MGYVKGVYVPSHDETGYDSAKLNDSLTRLSESAINVKSAPYGAQGNGTASDSAAIQAALDTGAAEVYVPEGAFKITAPLVMGSYQTLVGAGSKKTRLLHCAGANACITIPPYTELARCQNFAISGYRDPIGPNPNGTGTGVGIDIAGETIGGKYVTQTHIKNVWFLGVGDATHWAIKSIWGIDSRIAECFFTSLGGGGIYMGDTSNACTIRDLSMNSGTKEAIKIDNANLVSIQGCDIENFAGAQAIYISEDMQCSLREMWFENNTWDMHAESGAHVNMVNAPGHFRVPEGTKDTFVTAVDSGWYTSEIHVGAAGSVVLVLISSWSIGEPDSYRGDFNYEWISDFGRFGLIRIGGARYRLSGGRGSAFGHDNDGMVGFVEVSGAGSAFRLGDGAEIRFGVDNSGGQQVGDTSLKRTAANTLSMRATNAFKTGGAAHGSLPAASGYAAGAQFYCTSDKKPLWSDGSAHWVDAAGANHT